MGYSNSVCVIIDSSVRDREEGFSLRKHRRIHYLYHSALSSSLPTVQSSGRGVGYYVATDGLLGVGGSHEGSGSIYTRDDLVGDNDGDTKLVCYSLQ